MGQIFVDFLEYPNQNLKTNNTNTFVGKDGRGTSE